MFSYTKSLASFIARTNFNDLPKSIVKLAKLAILDFLGVCLAGCNTDVGKKVISFAKELGPQKEATIIGSVKVSAPAAAIANGFLGKIIEMEDGHRMIPGHLSITVIPASLSLAEREKVDGKKLITSIVLGYETSIRIAMAAGHARHPYPFKDACFLPYNTSGTLGAAVAASKILGLSEREVANALGIAAVYSPMFLWRQRWFGKDWALGSGLAALNGMLAAMAARNGFEGPEEVMEGPDGFCHIIAQDKDSVELNKLIEGLGKNFEMANMHFKPHAACRYTHAAIDATLSLVREYDIHAEDVVKVVVKTSSEGALRGQVAKSLYEAQFSIPFVVATAILKRRVSVDEYTAENLQDPKLLELMEKVKVTADPSLNTYIWPAIVEIETKDGRRYSQRVNFPKGEPEAPMSEEELQHKFRYLARRLLNDERVEKIIETVSALEDLTDVGDLMSLVLA